MPRALKPETEIRNLKRDLKDERDSHRRAATELYTIKQERAAWRERALQAERECVQWRDRFDLLLSRMRARGADEGLDHDAE